MAYENNGDIFCENCCCGKAWRARTLIAFWILGLTNNYGYVVMLSAAHDILKHFDIEDKEQKFDYKRECNTLSTGIILLADILPGLTIKIIAPFVPFYVFVRMGVVVICSAIGCILVAFKSSKAIVLTGVMSMSISSGLGEVTLLAYVMFFARKSKNVLSTWSSGTGAAGIFGSVSYAFLIYIGFTPVTTLLLMLFVPAIQAITFYLVVQHPIRNKEATSDMIPTQTDVLKFKEKIIVLPKLLRYYMIPYGLVYFFEYFINQGLFELMYFPDGFIGHAQQYRWYSVLYQVGVFISRSSMNIIKIDYLWTLAFIQAFNWAFCMTEVFVGFVKHLRILMAFIVWVGLIGGSSYVNTFRRIVTEMPIDQRQFCMAFTTIGDSFMIAMAEVISRSVHNHVYKT